MHHLLLYTCTRIDVMGPLLLLDLWIFFQGSAITNNAAVNNSFQMWGQELEEELLEKWNP